jgi:hypothetical protein
MPSKGHSVHPGFFIICMLVMLVCGCSASALGSPAGGGGSPVASPTAQPSAACARRGMGQRHGEPSGVRQHQRRAR